MPSVKAKKKSHVPNSAVAAHIRRIYSNAAPVLVGQALLFGAISVFMFMRPMAVLTMMTFLIGAGLVVVGLWRAIAGFVSTRGMGAVLDVLFGLLNIILGVLFCIYPTDSVIGISYIFIILFFFNALRILVFAINMARAQFGHYKFNLILAMVMTIVAAVLVFFPMQTAIAVVYYMAAALMLYAATDIYMFIELFRIRRLADE